MREKRLLGLVVSLCVLSCAFLAAKEPDPLYLERNVMDGSEYFVQTGSGLMGRELNYELCLLAARQIAIRKKAFVRYIVSDETAVAGASSILPAEMNASALVDFDNDSLVFIAENVEINEILKGDGAIQALLQQADSEFKHVSLSVSTRAGNDGNPGWVTKPPRSSRYSASVGAIRAADLTGNTAIGFQSSDTMAIAALAACVSEPVVSGGTRMYEAELVGAYVAARWYNAKDQTFYSLGILPSNK